MPHHHPGASERSIFGDALPPNILAYGALELEFQGKLHFEDLGVSKDNGSQYRMRRPIRIAAAALLRVGFESHEALAIRRTSNMTDAA